MFSCVLVAVVLALIQPAAAFFGREPPLPALHDVAPTTIDQFLPCFLADVRSEASPVFAQFCELAPAPSCFRAALRDILPDCNIADDRRRAVLAVQLTRCELSLAHVAPPVECTYNLDDSRARTACLRQLESQPHLWASFSGNFRSIKTICSTERLDHEREETIALHTNLTAAQQHALEIIHRQLSAADAGAVAAEQAVASWAHQMAAANDQLQALERQISRVLDTTAAKAEAKSDLVLQLWDRLLRASQAADGLAASTADNLATASREGAALRQHMAAAADEMHDGLAAIVDDMAATVAAAVDHHASRLGSRLTDVVVPVTGGLQALADEQTALTAAMAANVVAAQAAVDASAAVLVQFEDGVGEMFDHIDQRVQHVAGSLAELNATVAGVLAAARAADSGLLPIAVMCTLAYNGRAARLAVGALLLLRLLGADVAGLVRAAAYVAAARVRAFALLAAQPLPRPPAATGLAPAHLAGVAAAAAIVVILAGVIRHLTRRQAQKWALLGAC
ncbi:uncharacterized protein V1510DRAFT_428186 [Dipodascopsis tothii]|uniref:uncharacterized protein n=1 Tax=Dipodascopsis tothii TaxID=44089 RepID=UPI0034CE398B